MRQCVLKNAITPKHYANVYYHSFLLHLWLIKDSYKFFATADIKRRSLLPFLHEHMKSGLALWLVLTNRPKAGEQQRQAVTEEGDAWSSKGTDDGQIFLAVPWGRAKLGVCKAENTVVKQWKQAWEGSSWEAVGKKKDFHTHTKLLLSEGGRMYYVPYYVSPLWGM